MGRWRPWLRVLWKTRREGASEGGSKNTCLQGLTQIVTLHVLARAGVMSVLSVVCICDPQKIV